jgi:hypothetical protein
MSPEDLYPKHLTDQSRQVLDRLSHVVPDAVLIGGWATWLRARSEMSHDIDLIVDHQQRDRVAAIAEGSLSASTHVGARKWRAEVDGIHVDLYIPYESRLGNRLRLRVEDLVTETDRIDGWRVLPVEGHVITKMAALLDRPESQPGQKDRRELYDLLQDADREQVGRWLRRSSELEPGDLLNDSLTKKQRRQTTRWSNATVNGVRWNDDEHDQALNSLTNRQVAHAPTSGATRCGMPCDDGHRCRQILRPGSTCPHHHRR